MFDVWYRLCLVGVVDVLGAVSCGARITILHSFWVVSVSGSCQRGSIFTMENSRLGDWVDNQDGCTGCCGVAVLFATPWAKHILCALVLVSRQVCITR